MTAISCTKLKNLRPWVIAKAWSILKWIRSMALFFTSISTRATFSVSVTARQIVRLLPSLMPTERVALPLYSSTSTAMVQATLTAIRLPTHGILVTARAQLRRRLPTLLHRQVRVLLRLNWRLRTIKVCRTRKQLPFRRTIHPPQ